MAPNRPQLWWQAAWNTEPNDAYAARRWTDITAMVRKLTNVSRGRLYELAKSQAGQPGINFFDPNEYLNQANTASPYAPNVQPLKELLGQAMWPNGGTGNLINPDMWMPNDISPLDPSFESYANGAAAPSTLTAVGGVTATVTTTNPQQGTKSLTYTVSSGATRQGVSWDVPAVPGEEYTTSVYVRQSSASTQWLLVDDQNLFWDDFGRTSSNGWGTPDSGGSAYTTSGGAAADYSVSGGAGRHSLGSLNVRRRTLSAATDIVDVDSTVLITCPVLASGGTTDAIQAGLISRWTDVNNLYFARILFKVPNAGAPTIGLLGIELAKLVGGVGTILVSATSTLYSYGAGSQFRLRFQIAGSTLRARMWPAARLEPSTWDVTATDTDLTGPGAVGCHSMATSGITNTLPVVVSFDQLMVSGSTASTTTTTTGAYVRLAKTFTASQPVHTITVCTKGTAVAGTVNVDAIQHEPGAVANTFTTSGPNIFPILRDNVERWPRSNVEDMAGFAGQCDTTAVDGLAALNAITLDPDYVAAVMSLQPNYFWRLDGGLGSSSALETSGNQGPALVPFNTKYGPGVEPEFGSPIEIKGAFGGAGVKFTPTDNSTGSHADTILSLGRTTGTPGILWPRAYSSTQWSLTVACWVKCTASDPDGNFLLVVPIGYTSPVATVPLYLQLIGDNAQATVQSPTGFGVSAGPSIANLRDGIPHLLVATVTQVNGGNTTVELYVDGALDDTGSVTTAFLGGMFTLPSTVLNVGGATNGGQVVNGVVAHVALWERQLSASEVTSLWAAGGLGHNGELTGARLARRLAAGRYSGATRISAGSTTMQPSTAGTVDALTDAQSITVAEDGTLWVAPDGWLVFEGRQQRWLRLTPRGTFGEDEGAGEIPYLDGVVFDFDPAYVAANVKVARANGTTAVGGTQDAIETAARRYFPRSYTETSDFETDTLAQYKADWVFGTHKAPLMRVSTLTIDPASNPNLWKKALSVEVGQRWTVKRRAKAANSGAGIIMSEEYFVERVTHEINMDTGEWTISLLMSPIGLITNSPNVTFQPWILEHTTYGVLDSTTVLGW